MTADERDDDGPRGGRWLGVAFVAWAVLGLFTAQAVEVVGSQLGAPFPCALCSLSWCDHRAFGHALLHVVGLGLLWFAWSRAARRTAEVDGWRSRLAVAAPVFLLVATLLERLVDVESVMATGLVIGVAGVALVTPVARPWVRAMGWVCLVTALVGYDAVVLWRLSPGEARDPLFAIGLLAFGASVVVAITGVVRAWTPSPAPGRSPEDAT